MAEKEYIELEPVKRHIRYLIQDPGSHQAAPTSWADAYRKMIDILDDEPAADVRHVKRGKWEVGGMFDDIGRCSCCHYMFPLDTAMIEFHYCPNCGADMRPEEDNDG